MYKKLLQFLFAFLFIISISLLVSSCDDDEDDDPAPTTCDQCDASTPWSKPGITNCYATKADCESSEGGTCQNCN